MFGYLHYHHIFRRPKNIVVECCLYTYPGFAKPGIHILKYFFINVWISSSSSYIFADKKISSLIISIYSIYSQIFFYKCLDIFIIIIYFRRSKNYHHRLSSYTQHILKYFFINVWISSSSSYIFADKKISSSIIFIYSTYS
jgi:hypothetical protein